MMLRSSLLTSAAPRAVSAAATATAGGARRDLAVNPNEIKKRIKGTQSISKITKSMKMVSAAKLRGDQSRLEKGILFGRSSAPLLADAPFTGETSPFPETKAKNTLVCVLSSDKGLCGGINSFGSKMARTVHADAMKAADPSNPPKLFVLGGKSEAQLRRTHGKYYVKTIDECWKQPMNFAVASGMASELAGSMREGSFDELAIVYNSFKSVIKYDTTVQRIQNFELITKNTDDVPAPFDKYELEPDITDCVQNLFEWTLATTLYGCAVDNAASEQSARMTAMDNATKNAGEMINKLLLIYNRARQSKITTELIEIISGAESLKG